MSNKSVGEVESPRGGEVERFGVQFGVRYGFAGGGRACFRLAAESSDGVVERGWVVGVASYPPPYHAMEWTSKFSLLKVNGRY